MTAVTMNPRESMAEMVNPLGLDGIEFIEYATVRPQALGRRGTEGALLGPSAPLTAIPRP
jgi:hypothetical protein